MTRFDWRSMAEGCCWPYDPSEFGMTHYVVNLDVINPESLRDMKPGHLIEIHHPGAITGSVVGAGLGVFMGKYFSLEDST